MAFIVDCNNNTIPVVPRCKCCDRLPWVTPLHPLHLQDRTPADMPSLSHRPIEYNKFLSNDVIASFSFSLQNKVVN